MKAKDRLIPGPDDWWLTPQGAIFHQGESTAVIADVHLGYEWSRGHGGDIVPAHSLEETITRLTKILDTCEVKHLVVAGDLVESPLPCRRTLDDVEALERWLNARGVSLVRVIGNHDGAGSNGSVLTHSVGDWTIAHGHIVVDASKLITGHDHPILRKNTTRARCFLIGPSRMILPAFSDNAAGRNVAEADLPASWRAKSLRCWAATESRLLDFGLVDDLHKRLAKSAMTGSPEGRSRANREGDSQVNTPGVTSP